MLQAKERLPRQRRTKQGSEEQAEDRVATSRSGWSYELSILDGLEHCDPHRTVGVTKVFMNDLSWFPQLYAVVMSASVTKRRDVLALYYYPRRSARIGRWTRCYHQLKYQPHKLGNFLVL